MNLQKKEKIIQRIHELKEERNAVILAHNYQRGEVQDIADFVGDSLGLSQQAAEHVRSLLAFSTSQHMVAKRTTLNEILINIKSKIIALAGGNIATSFSLADDIWQVHVDHNHFSQIIIRRN